MEKEQKILPQKYVQYNCYTDRMVQSLQYFLNNKNFLDLTIICGNHTFAVHKIILSSLSPYFYNILKNETTANPTIILNDIPYKIMQKILVFMYSGSIKLDPEQVDDFIKVAKLFQIISNTNIAVQYIRGELKDEFPYQNIAETNQKVLVKEETGDSNVHQEEDKLQQLQEPLPETSMQLTTDFKMETEPGPSQEVPNKCVNYKKEKKPRIFGSRIDRELIKNPFFLNCNKSFDASNYSSARVRPISYLLRKRDSTDNSNEAKPKLPKKEPDVLCETCNKYYSHSTFNRHMKIHNLADYFFECEECKRLFKSYSGVYSHKYRVHGLLANGKRKNIKQEMDTEDD